jgi:trimethylamine--corrinoid protein Co-methyltransferase
MYSPTAGSDVNWLLSFGTSPSKSLMDHFMKEQFIPELTDRSGYDEWKKNGEKSLVDRASEKVKKILKEHLVPPLDKDIQKELHDIIKRAEKELPKKL